VRVPVTSTSDSLYDLMVAAGWSPGSDLAGVMLSGDDLDAVHMAWGAAADGADPSYPGGTTSRYIPITMDGLKSLYVYASSATNVDVEPYRQ
jgi:hypothetical protein